INWKKIKSLIKAAMS
uniref:Mastoparan-V2 n=1 Tax=Vespula vulgaris TaxID=7454 RepID=MAST2_VESVU|nr:RecName: Full=Mastoparan-V2 [Vespula vulgaris]